MRPRRVMQRVARYKKYMTQLGAEVLDLVQKYAVVMLGMRGRVRTPPWLMHPGQSCGGDAW